MHWIYVKKSGILGAKLLNITYINGCDRVFYLVSPQYFRDYTGFLSTIYRNNEAKFENSLSNYFPSKI